MTKITSHDPSVNNVVIPKKIELVSNWGTTSRIFENDGSIRPNMYENIDLIAKNYFSGYDLMFCWDSCRSTGVVWIGHWNDGVV